MPEKSMRPHLATLLDDFRRNEHDIAVVRIQGIRRRVATYGDIARQAGRFAALLEERGIGPGDRVVLWAENSAEWIAAFYGMMLRGVLAVPLDAYGSAEFAQRVAADVKPKLVVGDARLVRHLCRWPKLRFEEWADSLPSRESEAVEGLNLDTPLQILFTSGTTGEPKGIVHTHGNVLASVDPIGRGAQPYMRYERIFHPLRILHTLPLSHVFGQTMGLWVPAIFAAEAHFESRLVAPRLIETIRRERISVLAAVPRVMALLKAHLEATTPALAERIASATVMRPWTRWWVFRDVHRALGLKFWALVSGGGALPGPLEQFWNRLGLVVVQGYGMTETTALITLNHPFHVARGTIGKPLPGREVKIGPDGEVLVRGPMISNATWSGGGMRVREEQWLATGDIAEAQTSGELRFLGRKSETIVTAAGVNIHPEDLEAAIEQEPGVLGCAVVPVETAIGPEPFAVLAVRGSKGTAAKAIEHANAHLAEFQRVLRWAVWPEPDLPRTSTGKVRRKTVAAWALQQGHTGNGTNGAEQPDAKDDWLFELVAELAGEIPAGGDELRLSEDFHLDSLGRVQLAAAIEERFGAAPGNALDEMRTLGELRALVGGSTNGHRGSARRNQGDNSPVPGSRKQDERGHVPEIKNPQGMAAKEQQTDMPAVMAPQPVVPESPNSIYPHWPWCKPIGWIRAAFLDLVAQPLIWFLARPRVARQGTLEVKEPMLVVANHVTAYDGPLIEYALPGAVRRRTAIAMSGEMLEDYRHFRNPHRGPRYQHFMLFGPVAYLLVTALYNVFPLPRRRDFQRSFAHAGEALDRGMHVMVFPEGTRSAAGALAGFRPGIGLLVKQAQTAVLPVAIRGLGELKSRRGGWFRSGRIEVHVGQPMTFGAEQTEAEITALLHAEVERLLDEAEPRGISESDG
jgi:long-chain acyl-CoA synthetase